MSSNPPTYENDEDIRQLLYTEVTDQKLLDFFFKKGGKVNIMNLQWCINHYAEKQIAQNIVNLEHDGLIEPIGGSMYSVTKEARRKRFNYQKWSFLIGVILGTAIALTALIIALCKK
jgi:hypothetical protein